MRQEFLADIAEYYNCMAPNIQGQMQPAYASKLAKMKSVIQRLSVRCTPWTAFSSFTSLAELTHLCAEVKKLGKKAE